MWVILLEFWAPSSLTGGMWGKDREVDTTGYFIRETSGVLLVTRAGILSQNTKFSEA